MAYSLARHQQVGLKWQFPVTPCPYEQILLYSLKLQYPPSGHNVYEALAYTSACKYAGVWIRCTIHYP